MSARKTSPRRYAQGTDVPVERSRAELEKLLDTHGATAFAVYRDEQETRVVFRLGARMVRHVIAHPAGAKGKRDDAELRRRWRALLLITRAKLELIAGGDSTVEREFLADTMLPDGSTVYEAAHAQLAASYETGGMPQFFLGTGS